MQIWLEISAVAALAALGAAAGKWVANRGRLVTLIGFALPLILVVLIGLTRRMEALNFYWPFTWLTAGRTEFVILAFCGTMMLIAPASRLKRRSERRLVELLCFVAVFYFSLLPFIQPAVAQKKMLSIETSIDENGVCRQHFEYTCGPAAAVTGLQRLGIDAFEGEVAVAAFTSPIAGTAPDTLTNGLNQLYSDVGLKCEYRWFGSIEALPQNTIVLAVIRHSMMYDHFVCVLKVQDDSVLIGDPANGLIEMDRAEFRTLWRGSGVVLRKD